MIEQTVEDLTTIIGTRPACRALGAAPATIYRRRRPPAPRPARPRAPSPRALSQPERDAVLAELHCERFVDSAPAQVWATLLDEGRYLASERTMYRLLEAEHGPARERRDQLRHPSYSAPELLAERPNEVYSWDITKLKGPGDVDVLLSLRDPRRLQPIRRRLDRPAPRVRARRQGPPRAGLRAAAHHAGPADGACRSRQLDDQQARRVPARRSRRPQDPQPAIHLDRQPLQRSALQDAEVPAGFPARFDSIEHARAFCRDFFAWYNHEHRHSAIGLMTPDAVHHGRAQVIHADRARVLADAYASTPERFVRRPPRPPALRPPRGSTSPTTNGPLHTNFSTTPSHPA